MDRAIPAAEIGAQLEIVLASAGFSGAGRLGPFLRYLVEQSLAGESAALKEAVIGAEVFQRGAGYDPRVDPIVRVEARRLRSRLADYYAGPGAADPVKIDLPKGNYVPLFTANAPAPGPVATRSRRRSSGPWWPPTGGYGRGRHPPRPRPLPFFRSST
jgi:hypothetical protein